eukprot:939623-Prymnesium_polylepis.2
METPNQTNHGATPTRSRSCRSAKTERGCGGVLCGWRDVGVGGMKRVNDRVFCNASQRAKPANEHTGTPWRAKSKCPAAFS